MLTYEDSPTIRNAIQKRLHEAGKTEIADIKIINMPDAKPPHIQVGVWFILKDRLNTDGVIDPRSFFDLPAEFEHSHLLNEIDEIAEQLKVVRIETRIGAIIHKPDAVQPRKIVVGTGLRGNWPEKVPDRIKFGSWR